MTFYVWVWAVDQTCVSKSVCWRVCVCVCVWENSPHKASTDINILTYSRQSINRGWDRREWRSNTSRPQQQDFLCFITKCMSEPGWGETPQSEGEEDAECKWNPPDQMDRTGKLQNTEGDTSHWRGCVGFFFGWRYLNQYWGGNFRFV